MLIPIGHDKTTVRRWPWVTGAIVVVNVVASALTFPVRLQVMAQADAKFRAVEVIRFDGRRFDPRHVVGSPDLAPQAAFDQLVAALLQGRSGRRIAGPGRQESSRYAIFPSVEMYQRLLLDPWLGQAHLPPAEPGAADPPLPEVACQ